MREAELPVIVYIVGSDPELGRRVSLTSDVIVDCCQDSFKAIRLTPECFGLMRGAAGIVIDATIPSDAVIGAWRFWQNLYTKPPLLVSILSDFVGGLSKLTPVFDKRKYQLTYYRRSVNFKPAFSKFLRELPVVPPVHTTYVSQSTPLVSKSLSTARS